jgi:hypothetical protein
MFIILMVGCLIEGTNWYYSFITVGFAKLKNARFILVDFIGLNYYEAAIFIATRLLALLLLIGSLCGFACRPLILTL